MPKPSEAIVKLSILNSLTQILADWDLDLLDGMESTLELHDGSRYRIEVERMQPPRTAREGEDQCE